jgi:hypothetical protein
MRQKHWRFGRNPLHDHDFPTPRRIALPRPAAAFGKGGAQKIFNDGSTGIPFTEQSVDSVFQGVEWFEHARSNPFIVRASPLRSERERFLSELSELLKKTLTQVCQR